MITIPRDETKYPLLFECEGKHSTAHYLVQNKEGLLKAMFSIVEEWKELGYFFNPTKPVETEEEKKYAAMSTDVIDTLPADIQKILHSRRNAYFWKIQDYEEALDDYEEVEELLASKNPALTTTFIRSDKSEVEEYVVLAVINRHCDNEYQRIAKVEQLIVF